MSREINDCAHKYRHRGQKNASAQQAADEILHLPIALNTVRVHCRFSIRDPLHSFISHLA